MKISIVIFDDFTDLDVFLPWDLLSRVAWESVGKRGDWQVQILGTEPTHISMSGLRIPTTGLIEEAADSDAVIIASGSGLTPLLEDESYLKRFTLNPEKQLIGAMCSGSLLLARLGLLNERATTYPTKVQKLAEYGVEFVNESFVQTGNIGTAAGCLAGQELVAWIITTLDGPEMLNTVMESVQPNGND